MTIIRWEPARELQSFQQEVNRLFGTFFDSQTGGESPPRRWIPAVDLVDQDDQLVLRADLPGVPEQDINIEVKDDVLTVSSERNSERTDRRDGYHRYERARGRFSRSLMLPEDVDVDGIEASFERGVLEVRIPKPQERKPRRVTIGLGKSEPVIESEAQDGEASA